MVAEVISLSWTCFKDRADHRNHKLTMPFLFFFFFFCVFTTFFVYLSLIPCRFSVLRHFSFLFQFHARTSQNITCMYFTLHPLLFGLYPPNFMYLFVYLFFGKSFCMGSLLRKPFKFNPPNIITLHPRVRCQEDKKLPPPLPKKPAGGVTGSLRADSTGEAAAGGGGSGAGGLAVPRLGGHTLPIREKSLDLGDRQRTEARRRLLQTKRTASFRQNSATESADSIEIYIPEAQTRL